MRMREPSKWNVCRLFVCTFYEFFGFWWLRVVFVFFIYRLSVFTRVSIFLFPAHESKASWKTNNQQKNHLDHEQRWHRLHWKWKENFHCCLHFKIKLWIITCCFFDCLFTFTFTAAGVKTAQRVHNNCLYWVIREMIRVRSIFVAYFVCRA